ncbi:MAG: glutamate--tRNA ligase [Candidatus Marinimicrobia bacterium]|nr:glutamate--tRNA ligase [Candidatus Neomarinimicrobiota bacterium]MCF7850522.1 glutamate--tRNA ligase [Candidatus Neomarinimicrobiota bacterium]MCF7903965.1 glutamate--tRNA ligase [Candidatus Neomarinimicrobiota bacterium]
MTPDLSRVRVRFAPSPTGFLHIGGVRTALFNWLFARHHGGQFILRVDDTDQARNVVSALQPILDGFKWLGIDWDEGPECDGPHAPYFQSKRSDLYQKAVDTLLANGSAYKDYSRPEEFAAERQAAEKEKRQFIYSRTWMAETPEAEAKFEAEGRDHVIRLKMPREGSCNFHDLIRGDMSFNWAEEQDHVVQRKDGSSLYHLTSVVDDGEMEISHVIRAIEHLANTPRQIFIAQSLGLELPQYAHLPFVAEPGSSNKLSKRKLDKYLKNHDFKRLYDHGARIAEKIGLDAAPETFNPVIVDFFREIGFLPESIVNYLLLLGWSLDDKTEEFNRAEMIQSFSLNRVNKAPASFDPQKLTAFQERYMWRLELEDRVALVLPFLLKAGLIAPEPDSNVLSFVKALVDAAGERLSFAGDILDYEEFFRADDAIEFEEKALRKRLVKADAQRELLKKLAQSLPELEDFSAASVESYIRTFVEAEGVGMGMIVHALRVALTGKAVGFGLFEILSLLGKESCLVRISRAIEIAEASKE